MKELPTKEDYQPNPEDDEDAYSDYETKKKIEKQNTFTTGISSWISSEATGVDKSSIKKTVLTNLKREESEDEEEEDESYPDIEDV